MPINEIPNGAAKNPDQLTGWKEIAMYLDKAVRTVQRWEPELGMPVHRIGIRGSETIFAFKTELDAWRAGVGVRQLTDSNGGRAPTGDDQNNGRGFADSTDGVLGSGPDPVGLPSNRPRSRAKIALWTLAAVGTIVTVMAFGVGWWPALQPMADRTPASWTVDDSGFHVSNAAGIVLWSKTFPLKLSRQAYEPPEDRMLTVPVQIRDIDGDGRPEVLLEVDAAPSDPSRALYCFGSDGVEKWRHQVTRTVNYGSHGALTPLRAHNPPFMTVRFWVLDVGARTPEVWASARHVHEFPTVLQRLDPSSGRVLQEYWNNGDITVLTSDLLGGRRCYFVGAVKNEDRQAMLAVFDSKGPRGVAPAEDPYYACQDCGAGQPRMTFAFPRTEVASFYGTFPVVEAVGVTGRDLWVTVRQNAGHESDGHLPFLRAPVIYHFDSSLRLLGADFQVEYEASHRRLEQLGTLNHTFDRRSHERELWPVLRWDKRRWAPIVGPESPPR